MKLTWVGSNHLEVYGKINALSSYFFGGQCVFSNVNFICTGCFLLYFHQRLPQQEFLDKSIRICIYQTEQTYVKQTWHLSSFEAV